MKRILSILLVLISINVLGQEKEITYKSFLVIGFEGFRGINNVDDISSISVEKQLIRIKYI